MPRVSVIVEDHVVVVDGVGVRVDAMPPAAGLHAIQWDGTAGHIEPAGAENYAITDYDSEVKPFVDAHTATLAAAAQAEADADAAYRTSAQYLTDALNRIDALAGTTRRAFITSVAGQDMVYQRKFDEAKAYIAADDAGTAPDAADYPHLAAEVGITGVSVRAVADAVLARETAWKTVSPPIEQIRLRQKARARAAKLPDGVTPDADAIDGHVADAETDLAVIAATAPPP